MEDGLSLAFLCCYLGANGWRIQKIWEGESGLHCVALGAWLENGWMGWTVIPCFVERENKRAEHLCDIAVLGWLLR